MKTRITELFGAGAVVLGPESDSLVEASTSAQAAFWEGVFADIMAGEEAKEVAKRLSWNIEVVRAAALPAFFDKEYDSQRQALIELGLLRQ